MTLPQNILFDQDGTLFDPLEGFSLSLNYALKKFGLAPLPVTSMSRYIGPSLAFSFKELLPEASVENIDRAVKHYRECYTAEGWLKNRVYCGLENALSKLQASGRTLYVCTSKHEDFSRKIVGHFGLDKYFSGIYGCDVHTGKGELLRDIIQKHNLGRDDCMLIGDRCYDVEAAQENNVSCGGALWGYGSLKELQAAGAELLFDHPDNILDYI